MNHYFLPKSGWEFLDVSKVYGLGIIIHTLSGEAIVSDMGGYYLIETNYEIDLSRIDRIGKFLGEDQNLNWTLQTLTGTDKKTGQTRRMLKKEQIIKFLTNPTKINSFLEGYTTIKNPSEVGSGKETLYQTLDLAGTKGIRTHILKGSYSSWEKNIKIKDDNFMLSLLGHLNANIRKKLREKNKDKLLIFTMPTPSGTKIKNLLEIHTNLNKIIKGFHKAGWFPSLTQIAINLVLEELMVEKGGKFAPKFGSLMYGVMTKTGNQWKPLTGGIFPLDFLHLIADSDDALNTLNKWKNIFGWTSFKRGYEELPTSLAEFIANPDLSNYERYINLHLRNEIDKDKLKFGSYKKENLVEVMKNVRI